MRLTAGRTADEAPELEEARLAALFERGDYSGVALSRRHDVWQVPAAKGMIGLTAEALDGLARFDLPQARFHEAAANWIGGRDAAAEEILATLDGPHASRLLDLLRRPRIPVLSMLAYGPNTCLVLRDGAMADSRFDVTNIGYAPGDRPYRPGMDIGAFYDPEAPPAFFLTQMIEWHQFPANLGKLPCPLIGQTSDVFIHVQSMAAWLRLFDQVIVNDHTEHAAIRPLVGAPVSSFPKSFGHPASLPPFREGDRPIDVLMTGTMISPYHPDKGEVLRQLMSMDGVELAVVSGHIGAAAYYELLSQSKFTVAHYRCEGGLVTRSIESSAMGCIPLVQRGNSLRFYAGPNPAILDYDLQDDGLAQAVRDGLARYPDLAPRLHPTAEAIRSHLSPERVASQYLRFCTVLAARPERRGRPPHAPIPKRAMFWKGWSPGGGPFGDLAVITTLRRSNSERWRALPDAPMPVNERARELLLEHGSCLLHGVGSHDRRDEALALYRTAIDRFPGSLVLRFNYTRAALHFGTPAQIGEALAMARGTVGQGVSFWTVMPDEDVFPYDYAGSWFNYRRYLDLVTEACSGKPLEEGRLAALVLASLAHYVARCDGDTAMARRAVALDPEFGAYRMELARQLVELGTAQAADEAAALLVPLSVIPLHAVEASCLMRRLAGTGLLPAGRLPENGLVAQSLLTRTIDADAYQLRMDSPFTRAFRLGRSGHRGTTVKRRPTDGGRPSVSLILLNRSGSDTAWIAATIGRQDFPRARIEVIHVEQFGHEPGPAGSLADVTILCNPDGPLPHANRDLNEGLLCATAPVATVFDIDADAGPDLLARAVELVGGADHPTAIIDRDGVSGKARSLSFRVSDAIQAGGFDSHYMHYGQPPGLEDLFRRLLLAGVKGCAPDGTEQGPRFRTPGNGALERAKSVMFPGWDDPSRATPRHAFPRFSP